MPTLTEPIVRAVRRVVTGDPREKLNTAMAAVENLRQSLSEIENTIASRTDISRYQRATDDRYAKWQADPSNVDLEIDYKLAVMVFNSERERIEPVLRSRIAYPAIDEALGSLFKTRRDWRDVLKKAAEARLSLARHEHGKIFAQVRRQLGEGFDPQEDQRVKASQHQIARWEACVEQCETSRDEIQTWKRVTQNLFE